MGKSITDKEQQVSYMKQRLSMFLEVLDSIEPETAELEDIDRLIEMVDELDGKMQQFKNRPDKEPS
ncbi:SE1561 family protein [Planococcus sp. CAU13]|uniref:SE1561 family protein n=1 Tax=Planococcus sp. CAU13 TaxID=1541197 RepID=UPI00052FF154|nr:SE1561 family protein [Planococcus sp. CAU13]